MSNKNRLDRSYGRKRYACLDVQTFVSYLVRNDDDGEGLVVKVELYIIIFSKYAKY